jgi:histone H3/H4
MSRHTAVCMPDLIVKSNVQDVLDEMQVSVEFYDALDDEVEELVADAASRAQANDRTTVMPRDL